MDRNQRKIAEWRERSPYYPTQQANAASRAERLEAWLRLAQFHREARNGNPR